VQRSKTLPKGAATFVADCLARDSYMLTQHLAGHSPLFVGSDGQRITRGTLQYRVLRAFKKAGLDSQRGAGVLVHGFRHTFATELANGNVSVYALMKLLKHESMVTSQRYVDGAGTQNRAAAAQNPLYGLIEQSR
jgi:integrase/recombinase XerC